jgi:hypothetical protein
MATESRTPTDPPPGGAPERRRSWLPRVRIEGGHGAVILVVTWFGHEFVLLPTVLFLLALVSFGFCMVPTVLTLPAAVVAFWPWFAGAMEYPLVRALTVTGLTLFAGFLYVLRHAKRITYGYCEVAVGVVGLWAALSRLDADRMAVGLGIAASVYVIVRGMVNIADGRKASAAEAAEPPKPVPSAPAVPPAMAPVERPPSEPSG